MKAIVDGVELELTPKEFSELRASGVIGSPKQTNTDDDKEEDEDEQPLYIKKPTKKAVTRKSRKHAHWTKQEDALLKHLCHKNFNPETNQLYNGATEKIADILERTHSSVAIRASIKNYTGKNAIWDKEESSKEEDSGYMKTDVKHMKKNIQKEATKGVRLPPDEENKKVNKELWTLRKARKDAWKGAPHISGVSGSNEKMLYSILANVVQNGGKLTRNNEGYALGIISRANWDSFCSEIKQQSKKITNYLGVQGQFVLHSKRGQGYTEIRYKQ